jgi:hypothetical protein
MNVYSLDTCTRQHAPSAPDTFSHPRRCYQLLSLSLSRMLRRMNKHTEGNRAGPRFLYTHMEQDVDRSVKKITNRVLPTK